jgi:hypothetical protein
MRDDVDELLTKGSSYTVTHFSTASEDQWGRTDTTGTPTTEQLFIIRKYLGDKHSREGVKTVEYIIVIARYDSVLKVGDKISMDSSSYWVEGIQSAAIEGDNIFLKRVRAIKEEFA